MDLRQLAALTAVADNRSFSAAARALHTVQSNISTHVARLEREVGVILVDRASGSLTEAGELVVARARRIQSELDSLSADVASAFDQISGSVRLGVIGTTARWLVPILLRAMGVQYPRVELIVVDATTTSLLPQTARGDLDLAVVNLPVDDPDVATELLFLEDHVVACPPNHPLASYDHVRLDKAAEYPLLLEPRGTAYRDELEIEAARAGIALTPLAEVDGIRLLASLVLDGLGAAILPASTTVALETSGWRRVAIDGLAPRSVGLIQRRRALLSAPARALREVLCTAVRDYVPTLDGLRLVTPESAAAAT